MTGFAVVDVETTGLYNTDRIVEIGVVLLDECLRPEYEWCTLVNPHREVSGGHIHGITASDVADAPGFDAVAPHLAALLDHRVVVAHNAAFDLRMLAHALRGTAIGAPGQLVVVDTMRLARATLGGPASLPVVCEYLSIDQVSGHQAIADAHAAAEVLSRLMEQTDGYVLSGAALRRFTPETVEASEFFDRCLLDSLLDYADRVRWAGGTWADPAPTHSRAHASQARVNRDGYLARLLADLPSMPELAAPDLDPYLLAVEEALLDRMLTVEEAEGLATLARYLGLTSDRARAAHLAFVAALARAAWADKVVTPAEREDLGRVAELLGLSSMDIDAALEQARVPGSSPNGSAAGAFALHAGDRIVFTGEASVPRSVLSAKAALGGLVETTAVSKKTAALVVADPLSESTKARKARELSVPILAESVFVQMCDELSSARQTR